MSCRVVCARYLNSKYVLPPSVPPSSESCSFLFLLLVAMTIYSRRLHVGSLGPHKFAHATDSRANSFSPWSVVGVCLTVSRSCPRFCRPPCFCSTALSSVCLQLTGSGSSTSIMRSASLSLCAPCFFPVGNILQMSAAHHKRACVCSTARVDPSGALSLRPCPMLMPAPHVPTSRRARAPADHEQQERARETHTGDGTRTRRAIILRIMAPSPAPARLPARFGRRVRLVASGSGPPPPFPQTHTVARGLPLPSLVSRHGSFPASALPAPRRVRGRQATRPASSRISSQYSHMAPRRRPPTTCDGDG